MTYPEITETRRADYEVVLGDEPAGTPVLIQVWLLGDDEVLELRSDVSSTKLLSVKYFDSSSEAAWCYGALIKGKLNRIGGVR